MLDVIAQPILTNNYVWILNPENSDRVIVIDPGDADPVVRCLQTLGKRPAAILVTHRHWDHTDGIAQIRAYAPCPVYGPAAVRQVTKPLAEADTLTLLGIEFNILEVPGHTAEHIAYLTHVNKVPALFCGDTLFSAGCGRLLGGTAEQLKQSLDRLKQLPDDTQVYCTHEYTAANLKFARQVMPENPKVKQYQAQLAQQTRSLPSTIALEKSINPFLRCDDAAVQHSVETHAGRQLQNELAVFKHLRAWKDHF